MQASRLENTFFVHGGELGELMRTHNWAASPLGSVENWPLSLRTMVNTCLNSDLPMAICWGPDLIMLYNDGYRRILGNKHPTVLGHPCREVWTEIWPVVGPMLHSVLDTGRAVWLNDFLLRMERHGYAEECYFISSCSPIVDEAGQIRGVFVPVTETTERVLGERHLEQLREEVIVQLTELTRLHEFSARLATGLDLPILLQEVLATVTTLQHTDTGALLLYDTERNALYFEATLGLGEEFVTRMGRLAVGRAECGTAVVERRPVVVEDIEEEPLFVPYQETLRQAGIRATYTTPLISRVGTIVGTLVSYFREPHRPSVHDMQLVDLYARQAADAIESARLHQRISESEERLRLATDSAEVGIWHYDIQKDRLLWSPQFKRLFGLVPDDVALTYQQFLDHVHPEDRQRIDQLIKQILAEGKDFEVEYRVVWPDGSIYWIAAKGRVLADSTGQPSQFMGVGTDITVRKQAEEAREHLLSELQRSNAELEQFAYVASHDLQAPLRTVSSFVQLLAKRYQGQLGPDADEFIGFAIEGAQRMQQLIHDLLTFARVGSKGGEFAPVDCDVPLKQALDSLQSAIAERGAQVTYGSLPTLIADAGQLKQLFQNLLDNALKFRGPEDPRIHIAAKREGKQWVFSVHDNGIGLEPRQADRIFQVFQRLHTRKVYPGTGIGLSICKKIVERHGGRIWVESTLGQGATFFFTIGL